MLKVFGRAVAQSVSAVIIFILIAKLARFFGLSELSAVGIGVVTALAPGTYDYLGRDLLGRRIENPDPLDSLEDPWMWIGNTRFTRKSEDLLNDADLTFALRMAPEEMVALGSVSTISDWRALNPESDLATSVIDALEDSINDIRDWTPGHQLPMFGLFLADLRDGLLNELGSDFNPLTKSARLQ